MKNKYVSIMQDLTWFAVVIILAFGAGALMCKQLDRPDVIFSYSTGECLRVDNADGTHGSCDNIPDEYNHVWGR